MPHETEYVIVDYDEVVQDRELSIIVRIDKDTHVFPKSEIIDDDGSALTIPEWLAKDRGLV